MSETFETPVVNDNRGKGAGNLTRKKRDAHALFSSAVRRELFQILCQHPGRHLSLLAQTIQMSTPAVRWHLEQMIDAGFVAEAKIGRNRIYYPRGMIDPNHITIFTTLSKPPVALILLAIHAEPGMSQKALAHHVNMSPQQVINNTKKLRDHRLITTELDGRSKRYYPTPAFETLLDQYQKRSKLFRQGFIKQLRNEGITITSLKEAGTTLVLTIGVEDAYETLTISTTPLSYMFSQ